ncbi:hypothetical protein KEJ45_03705 [Candidatus Bathyarchaeota archaeon]|nr:hypothetical protein [Candidatus Bathyarchaeota archaeon]
MDKRKALYIIGAALLIVSALLTYRATAEEEDECWVVKFPDGSYIAYCDGVPIGGYNATLGLYWDNFQVPPSISIGPAFLLPLMSGISGTAGVGCIILARKNAKNTTATS